MKKTLLAALLLGTTVTTNVDAAMVVYEGDHQSSSAHTHQPSGINNPYTSFATLSYKTATIVYHLGEKVISYAGNLLSSFFNKQPTYIPIHSPNEPFGNEAPHVRQLVFTANSETINAPFEVGDLPHIALTSSAKDGSATPPSTRAASVERATPEAIEKDTDTDSMSSSVAFSEGENTQLQAELELLMKAGQLTPRENADGLLVTPRATMVKPVEAYTAEERAEIEAFIRMVLAEDQAPQGTHDPLEDSIVFAEEDDNAAAPSKASEEAAKPAVKPSAKKTAQKTAPVIRMTRAQQLLAAENAAKVQAAKKEDEKKAAKPAGKRSSKKAVVTQ